MNHCPIMAGVAAVLIGCASGPHPAAGSIDPATAATPAPALATISLPPELDRVLRDYERDWRAKDAAGLAAQFTEDGFVLSSGRPPVRGRAAIAEAYTGRGGALSLKALGYATGDTVGYIVGSYGWDDANQVGKFVLALRREPGGPWRIAADMDNANTRH